MTQPEKSNIKHVADFLQFQFAAASTFVMLREQARVMWLRAHPWCHEFDNRLRVELHELAHQEELLLRARAKLLGERRRPIEIEPLGDLTAPSEHISGAGAAIGRALEVLL